MKESTRRFLDLVNEANAKIAEREAEEKKAEQEGGVDPIREQRQAERRERLGQLRARPKAKRKTSHVRNAFGNTSFGQGPND